MLEIAFRFSRLGEKTLDLHGLEKKLYTGTHNFIYQTIIEGLLDGKAQGISVDFADNLIPFDYTEDCEDYRKEISCNIEFHDSNSDVIWSDCSFFQKPIGMNIHSYMNFARESLEKSTKTALMPLCIDYFVLERFVDYAFKMGAGMPVRDAVLCRMQEVQREYCKLS